MLSDWHSHSKVVVGEVGADSLITEDYIEPDDGVLRIFGALEEHIDVNVLNQV